MTLRARARRARVDEIERLDDGICGTTMRMRPPRTVFLEASQPGVDRVATDHSLPDGRWMAYDSDESGRGVDVFIQSFPDPQLKRVKFSPPHGSEPMWTQGGRELAYRDGDKVMAASIDLATGSTGAPRLLFSGPYPDNPGWTRPRSYDVTPDGEPFLMTRLSGEQRQPRIVVVLNWFNELRAKVRR
jgi:Tol biopolymer transport system component